MQMHNETRNVDIVIIGASLAGSLTALLLAKNKNLNILILDKKIPNTENINFNDKNKYQPRVVALNLASKKILGNIGVWNLLPELRLGGMRKISVSESNGPQKIEFDGFASGHDNLAYVVENDLLLNKLQEKLKQINNIKSEEVEINKINNLKENAEIILDNKQKIKTKLIIAADGANSFIRNYFDLKTSIKDYGNTALVANIYTDKEHENIARQKFLKSGPIALLPLGDANNISIVWSTNKEFVEKLINYNEKEFCFALNREFNFKIGDNIKLTSKRFTFSLFERHAESYFCDRVVLLGDAAHTIHPLAGQGLNLGILDSKILTDEIMKAYNIHSDFGSIDVLQRYQARRRGHNQILIYAMRFFQDLYCIESLPGSIIRNLGVGIFNSSNFIKDKIIKFAIGQI